MNSFMTFLFSYKLKLFSTVHKYLLQGNSLPVAITEGYIMFRWSVHQQLSQNEFFLQFEKFDRRLCEPHEKKNC